MQNKRRNKRQENKILEYKGEKIQLDKVRSAIAKEAKKMVPKEQKEQFSAFMHPFTDEEHALLEWAITLADPTTISPKGMPSNIGANLNPKSQAQYTLNGTAVANASGFAFVAFCTDWAQGTALGGGTVKYCGHTTQGTPVWFSNASYVGTATPAIGATTATTGLLSLALPGKFESGVGSTTEFRQISACIDIWSEAPSDTAQGSVVLLSSISPDGGPGNGGLDSMSFSTGVDSDPEMISRKIITHDTLGKTYHRAIALPFDQEASIWREVPSAGTTAMYYPSLTAICGGFAANQSLRFKITINYEYTTPAGYRIESCSASRKMVDSTLASKVPALLRPASVHAIKPNGGHKALGPAAGLQAIADSNPPRGKGIWDSIKSGAGSILGSASPMIKNGVSTLLSNVPYVGNLLSKGFNWLFG